MADGDQTKDEPFTPLASAAQKVKDKDVEVIAFSTIPEGETNLDDLRQIASGDGDENVYVVAPNEPAPAITTKIVRKVKSLVRGKEHIKQLEKSFSSFNARELQLVRGAGMAKW